MTDCSNMLRDALPDYLHEQLSSADVLAVEQHVNSCAECASDLVVLRAALRLRSPVGATKVADIVASLSRPGGVAAANTDPKVRALSSAPSLAKKSLGGLGVVRNWRAAAAIIVVAIGGMSIATLRREPDGRPVVASTVDSAHTPDAANPSGTATGVAPATANSAIEVGTVAALPVGELSDYSDEEIESVIQRLDKWDGAAAAEPLPGVPLLPASTGVIP